MHLLCSSSSVRNLLQEVNSIIASHTTANSSNVAMPTIVWSNVMRRPILFLFSTLELWGSMTYLVCARTGGGGRGGGGGGEKSLAVYLHLPLSTQSRLKQ